MKAYLDVWRRCFDYSGVTNRREFITAYFCHVVALLLFGLVAGLLMILFGICEVPLGDWYPSTVTTIMTVFNGAILIPLLSMTVRRLRDAGYSATSFFWLLLPGIGMIALFVRLLGKTKSKNIDTNI